MALTTLWLVTVKLVVFETVTDADLLKLKH